MSFKVSLSLCGLEREAHQGEDLWQGLGVLLRLRLPRGRQQLHPARAAINGASHPGLQNKYRTFFSFHPSSVL